MVVGKEQFMETAVELAIESVLTRNGGPFGCVIVKNGEIIGRGKNSVTTKNDPTAHAEIMAIRDACENLSTFQLDECDVYTSCEPCPMCLGAIYWARPKAVYYASTKTDAAAIHFDDQFIYEEIDLVKEKRSIPFVQLTPKGYEEPFKMWEKINDKVEY